MIGFDRVMRYLRRVREAGILHILLIAYHRVRGYLLYPEYCAKRYGLFPSTPTGRLFAPVLWRREEVESIAKSLAMDRVGRLAEAAAGRAERATRGEFSFLGWGPITFGKEWPWQSDFYHAYVWPDRFHKFVDYVAAGQPCDVKVPWELSRLQFLVWYGQAWLIDGNPQWPRRFLDVLNGWRARNPVGYGVNWTCAMEVAIRAINVVAAFDLLGKGLDEAGTAHTRRLLEEHYRFLSHNLEYSDIPGNHYFFDVLGLALLSISLEGPGSRRTRNDVRRMMSVVDSQFQQDGTHLENATGYHRLVTEGLVLFIRACRRSSIELPARALETLSAAARFMEDISTPAGDIPLFGDSDSGRVLILADSAPNNVKGLLAAAKQALEQVPVGARDDESAFWLLGHAQPDGPDIRPTPKPVAFASYPGAGIHVFRLADTKLILRCGAGGLNGRGSHDHNDQLSCVLYSGNEVVLLDPGCSNYTFDVPSHARDVSTAQHNCIMVGGVEQSPINQGSVTCSVRSTAARCELVGAGDGRAWFHGVIQRYGGVPGVTVRRVVSVAGVRSDVEIAIEDEVIGMAHAKSVASYHFGPSWRLADTSDGILARSGSRTVALRFEFANELPVIEEGVHSMDYGATDSHKVVRQTFRGNGHARLRAVVRISAEGSGGPC